MLLTGAGQWAVTDEAHQLRGAPGRPVRARPARRLRPRARLRPRRAHRRRAAAQTVSELRGDAARPRVHLRRPHRAGPVRRADRCPATHDRAAHRGPGAPRSSHGTPCRPAAEERSTEKPRARQRDLGGAAAGRHRVLGVIRRARVATNRKLSFEIDQVPFVEGPESASLDDAEVHEGVDTGWELVAGDGAPPLLGFEELHRSRSHRPSRARPVTPDQPGSQAGPIRGAARG
jgi:hypothetical protein